jgi:hypothetical protein
MGVLKECRESKEDMKEQARLYKVRENEAVQNIAHTSSCTTFSTVAIETKSIVQ